MFKLNNTSAVDLEMMMRRYVLLVVGVVLLLAGAVNLAVGINFVSNAYGYSDNFVWQTMTTGIFFFGLGLALTTATAISLLLPAK